MRILLTLLSLLLAIPAIGCGTSSASANDEEGQKQEEQIENKHPSVFYCYGDCLEQTRKSGKNTIIVLMSDPDTIAFCDLQEMAFTMEGSVLGNYANFVVLSPLGISLLIYPPIPEPMLEEISKFQDRFPETSNLKGSFLITISVGSGQDNIMDITPINLPEKEAIHRARFSPLIKTEDFIANKLI
ncbi:hypothetical protein [Chlamydia vaughanii]|uniref:hypothetical protein n=1 Tax=Chlamydia vaughanii TaxID=3112552 RepID=UPI0032B15E5E